ncbi:multiple PDZ domain protein-like [Carassius gibelio]|uniref:multiple PDZ domain protein-like n=1 Tax=Carassius gibelio TaxID=101364 RepID=UPI002279E640|nr:multiple PDZ domain protein-like [Carassius gibelio]
MYVNNINLGSASLEEAVQALKGADLGTVRIGVAKPLPIDCSDLELSDEKAFEHHFLEEGEEEEEEEEVLQSMIAEHSSADLTYLMSDPASTQKEEDFPPDELNAGAAGSSFERTVTVVKDTFSLGLSTTTCSTHRSTLY